MPLLFSSSIIATLTPPPLLQSGRVVRSDSALVQLFYPTMDSSSVSLFQLTLFYFTLLISTVLQYQPWSVEIGSFNPVTKPMQGRLKLSVPFGTKWCNNLASQSITIPYPTSNSDLTHTTPVSSSAS
jgi:hypothetical protein